MIAGMSGVSVRDARALLDVAGTLEYDPRRGTFTLDGLAALCELLGADWVGSYERPRTAARASWPLTPKAEVETRPFVGRSAELEATFRSLRHQFKLGMSPAPDGGVVLIGDLATDRTWRRTAFYNEWCREVHIEPQARVVFARAAAPMQRALMIDVADDTGRAFGERERTLLKLIRPTCMRLLAAADAAAERRRALGLTPRELQVLGLVRDGMTNGEIATHLFLSPATIRTHLENAFRKIGAHTRTEAIARLGA
jgi:DNA-binding CsgD family transcriptional regulator